MRIPRVGERIRWDNGIYLVVSSDPRIIRLVGSRRGKDESEFGTEFNLESYPYPAWEDIMAGADIEFFEDPFVTFVKDVLDAQNIETRND